MSINQIYFKYVSESFLIFKENLKKIGEKIRFEFFLLNKLFFNSSEKRDKVNHLMLLKEYKDGNDEDLIIDPEKDFYLLTKSSWLKIKEDFPNEIELKFFGYFFNNKFVLEINQQIYYFYFINDNDNNIEEGYFKFNNQLFAQKIILKFLESEISTFFNEIDIRKVYQEQIINYNKRSFIFRLKEKEQKDDIIFISKNNENYIKSLKIYKCIFYYFDFRYWTINIFLENLEQKKYKFYLIDSNWLNNFKKKCNYELIKKVNDKENFPDYKEFSNFFTKNYPLPPEILDNKPKRAKKIKIDVEYYYYEDFDFIDESTMDIFLEAFNYSENKYKFRLYDVIKFNNVIILIYNNISLEIILIEDSIRIIKKERLLFTVNSYENLKIIKNVFLSTNYENALTELDIKNKNLEVQKVYKNKSEIGTMRNISFKVKNEINLHTNKIENKIFNKNEKNNDKKILKTCTKNSKSERNININNTENKDLQNNSQKFNELKKNLFNTNFSNTTENGKDNKIKNNFLTNNPKQNPQKIDVKQDIFLGQANSKKQIRKKNDNIKSFSQNKFHNKKKNNLEIIKEENKEEDTSIVQKKKDIIQLENNNNIINNINKGTFNINLIDDIQKRNTQNIINNNENLNGGNSSKIQNDIINFNQNNIKNKNNIGKNINFNEHIKRESFNNNNFQNNIFTNDINFTKNNINNNNNNNNINTNDNIINNNKIMKNKAIPRKRPQSSSNKDKNIINKSKSLSNTFYNIKRNNFTTSIIQCLANIKSLTKYLLKNENVIKFSSNKSKYKLTNAYIDILNNIWIDNDLKKLSSTSNIEKVINEINSFTTNSENLIMCFFEILHNELNEASNFIPFNQNVNQFNFNEVFQSFSQYFMNNYQSKISNLFYGMYNSMMACDQCGATINNVQCNFELLFSLDEVKTFKNFNEINIYDCLNYYKKINFMGDNNQIFCNNCHNMANSFNSKTLLFTPNVLMISLHNGKDVKFLLEELIDIHNFLHFQNGPFLYELIGIVTLITFSNNKKNYVPFCKSFNDKIWYKYDNEKEKSSFEEVKTTGIPYCLFYSGINNK